MLIYVFPETINHVRQMIQQFVTSFSTEICIRNGVPGVTEQLTGLTSAVM